MLMPARRTLMMLGAFCALAVGGAAIAGAATNGTTTPSPTVRAQPPNQQPLTGATADKVKAAALAKVPGGSVVRVETDADHGSPYEAHVRKSDGSEVEVLVNKDFKAIAVNEVGRRP